MVDVDVSGLRALRESDPTARALLEHLAQRKRGGSSTVDRLHLVLSQEGKSVARADLIAVLKRLDELGCGEFLVGRRGHQSRFEWSASPASLGMAAAGSVDSVDADDEAQGDDAAMIKHPFRLRRDLLIELRLPADLTDGEAARLSEFIKTLPF